MRIMDGDFHPEGEIPDGCLPSFSSLLSFLHLSHLLCVLPRHPYSYFSSSPVLKPSGTLPLGIEHKACALSSDITSGDSRGKA